MATIAIDYITEISFREPFLANLARFGTPIPTDVPAERIQQAQLIEAVDSTFDLSERPSMTHRSRLQTVAWREHAYYLGERLGFMPPIKLVLESWNKDIHPVTGRVFADQFNYDYLAHYANGRSDLTPEQRKYVAGLRLEQHLTGC